MEPRQHSPNQLPKPASGVEAGRSIGLHEIIGGPEQGMEQRSGSTERQQSHQVESVNNLAIPMPVLPPPVDPKMTVNDPVASVASDAPITAADEELIEKEWVDKAKQIISSTKDDPFQREREIKKLQIDYVKKRYGRIIGDAERQEAV